MLLVPLLVLLFLAFVGRVANALACDSYHYGPACQYDICTSSAANCNSRGSCITTALGNTSVPFPVEMYSQPVIIQNNGSTSGGLPWLMCINVAGSPTILSPSTVASATEDCRWSLNISSAFPGRHLLTRLASGTTSPARYLLAQAGSVYPTSTTVVSTATTFLIVPSPYLTGAYRMFDSFGRLFIGAAFNSTRRWSEFYVEFSSCNCTTDWAGSQCTSFTPCEHGQYNATSRVCTCLEGWNGATCATRSCISPVDGTVCSGHGTCSNVTGCTCNAFSTGPTCRIVRPAGLECHVNHTLALNCSSPQYSASTIPSSFTGYVMLHSCTVTPNCVCDSTVTNSRCFRNSSSAGVICSGYPSISVGTGNGTGCTCFQRDTGNECGSGYTLAPSICSGELGSCACQNISDPICNEGWTGPTCTTRTCANPLTGEECSNAGTCISNICTCHRTRYGPTCRHEGGAVAPAWCGCQANTPSCASAGCTATRPESNPLLDNCTHQCAVGGSNAPFGSENYVATTGICVYGWTQNFSTTPLTYTGTFRLDSGKCWERYSDRVVVNGYCNWENTVGVNCSQWGQSSTTIHGTRLLNCTGTLSCVCKTSPYRQYDSGCREITCKQGALGSWQFGGLGNPLAVNSDGSRATGHPVCNITTGGKCPLTGCSNCAAFETLITTGPLPHTTFTTDYAGTYCCVNAFTDPSRVRRAVCGGRGQCGRDSECICDSTSLGGLYCCPIGSGQSAACGAHGTCAVDGTCACDSGWSGTTCQTDISCGSCGNGTCFNSNPIHAYLTRLRMDLAPAFPAGDSWVYVNILSQSTAGAPRINTIELGDAGMDQNYIAIADASSVSREAAYGGLLIRKLFMDFNFGNFDAFRSPYFIDCFNTPVVFSTSLYDSILGLSRLPLYRARWRTNGAVDVTPYVDAIFASFHEPVAVPDPTYRNAVINAINGATTDAEVAFALSALMVYQVLLTPQGAVTYPSSSPVEACVCAAGKAGPNCEYTCPIGSDGQMCSGFAGGVWRGTCNGATGVCACASFRRGDACEADVVGHCVATSQTGVPVCSNHGTCANTTNVWRCTCESDWTGHLCNVSACAVAHTPYPNDTTIECSNHGTCNGATQLCECDDTVSSSPFTPTGLQCELNGASACASLQSGGMWMECGGHGSCIQSNVTGLIGCVCLDGYFGAKCNSSVCGICNDHETCNAGSGQCQCNSRYSTLAGSCPSNNVTCRCQQALCGHGSVSMDGTSCLCDTNYRVDSGGNCTIVQCPLVQMTDYGPVRCNGTETRCAQTGTLAATASDSHVTGCCYDACISSGGVTQCSLVSGQPVCACDSNQNYQQSSGICYPTCHGHPVITGPKTCNCSITFPLYPPLDTVREFLTSATCTRTTCLNGGVKASSGQSCVCANGFSGPVCATSSFSSSSSTAAARSSSSSSTGGAASSSLSASSAASGRSSSSVAPTAASSSSAVVSSSALSTTIATGMASSSSSADTAAIPSSSSSSSSSSSTGPAVGVDEVLELTAVSATTVVAVVVATTGGAAAIALTVVYWTKITTFLGIVPGTVAADAIPLVAL